MKKFLAFSTVMMLLPALSVSAALLEGKVERVDKSKKQILLQTRKGQETVIFTDRTKGAAKVKIGDKVKIKYTEKSGKNVADSIDAGRI